MSHAIELVSNGPEATQVIGRALGAALCAGDVIGLIGSLGAGKTVLVKGIAAGADVSDRRRVTSPTFVIVNEYEGRLRLFHIDAYRLGGGRELEALGVEEFIEQGAVVVEWADRTAEALPTERLTITIEPTGETRRRLLLHGRDERARRLIEAASRSG